VPEAEFDAGRAPGSVEQLDASDGSVVGTIDAPPLPPPPGSLGDMGAVAFGADAVWFLSGNQTVSRIDAASATVAARIRFEGQVAGIELPSIAAGEDGVWVSAGGGVPGGVLTRIDPATNEQVAALEVPGAGPVAAGLGGVWIADQWYDSQSVWQIDSGVNRVVRSIRVGPLPFGIALGEGAVWVTTSDGMVSRIDPTTSKVVRQIRVGGTPFGIAVGDGFVWVARA
jgi:YVTN family beta-propeller protein